MKLMNILLFCSLMNNAYPMNLEDLSKIKKIASYFKPNALQQLVYFFKSDDPFKAAEEVNSGLLFLFILNVLSREEAAQFSKERLSLSEIWIQKKNELQGLQDKEKALRALKHNVTPIELCNQLFNDILTGVGCQKMAEENKDGELIHDIKYFSEVVKKTKDQEELDKMWKKLGIIFNDEEVQ